MHGEQPRSEERSCRRSDRIRISQRIREAEGYLELGMPQNALDALARIDDAGTSRGQLRYLQGLAYRELERHREAVAPLRDATDAIPSNLGTWIALAWCLKRSGQLTAAIDTLQEAKEFHEDEHRSSITIWPATTASTAKSRKPSLFWPPPSTPIRRIATASTTSRTLTRCAPTPISWRSQASSSKCPVRTHGAFIDRAALRFRL